MRRRFRPSESWFLEERIALSHAAEIAALAAPRAGLRVVFHGAVTTTTRQGVDTNSQVAALSGTGRVPGFGPLNLAGTLNSSFVNVRSFPDSGRLVVIARTHSGTMNLTLTGPHSDLAPRTATTSHFTFRVSRATGQFASLVGATGTADLTLKVRGPSAFNPSHAGTSHGNFTLALKQG